MLALRHPNCCSILGVCESPPCLVTGARWCSAGMLVRAVVQPGAAYECAPPACAPSRPAALARQSTNPLQSRRVLRARQRHRGPACRARDWRLGGGAADLGTPAVHGAGLCKGHDLSGNTRDSASVRQASWDLGGSTWLRCGSPGAAVQWQWQPCCGSRPCHASDDSPAVNKLPARCCPAHWRVQGPEEPQPAGGLKLALQDLGWAPGCARLAVASAERRACLAPGGAAAPPCPPHMRPASPAHTRHLPLTPGCRPTQPPDYGLSKYMGGDSDRSSSMAAMNPRWVPVGGWLRIRGHAWVGARARVQARPTGWPAACGAPPTCRPLARRWLAPEIMAVRIGAWVRGAYISCCC